MFTAGFTAGTIFGIALMIALWKWVEGQMDRDDRKDWGDME